MALPNYRVWDIWAEFIKTEINSYGPDCQLKLLVALGEGRSPVERIWLNGCYAAHHCVPSAYALWREFPYPHLLAQSSKEQDRLEDWLEENWTALPVRPEMRSHRMVVKRKACIVDFAKYAISETWRQGVYEDIWSESISAVRYYNRYMAIKYLELKRMVARPDIVLTDMRAKSAWSPRIGLALLFPNVGHIIGDREDNSAYAIELTEDYALECLDTLSTEYGLTISHFQLQVLLCNFREMLVGGFYPRAGHDEEMDYIKLAEKKFDMTPVWEARSRIFNNKLLGEHNGWFGIQKSEYARWKEFGKGVL
jgi:hypothetical protein